MSESGDSGVACEAPLALRWAQIGPLTDAEFLSMALSNEERLRVINGIDEFQVESEEDVMEIAVQLQRLEFKINLALDMLSELLLGRAAVPSPTMVSLSPTHLIWHASPAPTVSQYLRADLFLHRRYPFPISLTGKVAAVEGDRVELTLDPQPDSVKLLLEKFIFRCHRRQIARLRQRL